MGEETKTSPGRTLVVAALLGVHLLLVAYFAPRSTMLSTLPLLDGEFAIEAYRVAKMHLGLELFGRPFVFDPAVSAGQIAGLSERLGTRVFLLLVPPLTRAGVPEFRAFNLVALGFHLVFPLVALATAKAFGLRGRAAPLLVALWSALWFFDSSFHFAWHSGRGPWVLASGLSVLGTGLVERTKGGGVLSVALATAVFVVAMLCHPVVAALSLAVGTAVALGAHGLLPSSRLRLAAIHVSPLLTLFLPLHAPGAFTSEPIAEALHGGLGSFFLDAIDESASASDIPSRTLFRALCLVAGAIALHRARSSNDTRYGTLADVAVVSFALAYLGRFVPMRPVDPPLFVIPATLAASVPAASLLSELSPIASLRSGSTRFRAIVVLAALVVVPRLYGTIATYVPEILPARVVRSEADLHVSALAFLGDPLPSPRRHEVVPRQTRNVAAWLSRNAMFGGRILVDDPALAALLSLTTSLPVIGPLTERGSSAGAADPASILASSPTPGGVHAYLQRYAVSWVVLKGPFGVLDRDDPTLEPPIEVEGFRVRRVRSPASLVLAGTAQIERATDGVIAVTAASGPAVSLRFHYHPLLRCRPGCRVSRLSVDGDDAGFIAVPSPPPAFEVYLP